MTEPRSEQPLLVEKVGAHILHLTLNRPQRRNAINGAMAAALDAAVKRAEADPAIRVVVLSSTGEQSFCAGADLAEVAQGREAGLSTKDGGFAGLIEARRQKPWIAAVDAPAFGGGLEICLALDMIVASARASFALPEVRRGVVAGAGGMFRLPRRIPGAVAMEMLATGEPIDAQRALALGLVNHVAAPGEAVPAALALAARIAANAPVAVQLSLAVARRAQDLDEAALFAAMADAVDGICHSADAREGVQAFLEKRQPVWRGA